MSENIDDDLEWLIEDDADVPGEKPSVGEEEKPVDTKSKPEKSVDDDTTHHTDTDTDDEDDGLTPDERELLERNTLLNDASDREDYDLKNKLQKANADLEKIDDSDSSREVKVMFKKKLVDVEAPPYDYSSDSSSSSDSDDESSKPVPATKKKSSSSSSSSSSEDEGSKSKDIVVERGGKFQLISSSEKKQSVNTSGPSSSYSSTPEKPTTSYESPHSLQEPKKRPNSAPVSQSRNNMNNYQSTPRPGSASRSNEYSHLKSPYGMSPEMKELMRKRAAARSAREEEERAQEKQKQEENRQNAEYAWKCWVEKKDEEMKERKRLDEEEKEKKKITYDSKREADEAYALWLSEKRKQGRKDRMVEQQRQLEIDEGWYRRDRKECDKAYKRWLRQKSEESRKQQMQARKFGQQSRADAYRMKKLQRLIMSIQNSQRNSY